MAKGSLTDDDPGFNQPSNSEGSSFRRPTFNEYLASLDDELLSYLGRLNALITVACRSDFSDCAWSDVHHYFAVLDEQILGARQTFAEIQDQRRLVEKVNLKNEAQG